MELCKTKACSQDFLLAFHLGLCIFREATFGMNVSQAPVLLHPLPLPNRFSCCSSDELLAGLSSQEGRAMPRIL